MAELTPCSVWGGGELSFEIRIRHFPRTARSISTSRRACPFPLGPTGLFISNFRAGVEFGATFPTITIHTPPQAKDALQLRQPGFDTPDMLTPAQWESQLQGQVVTQYMTDLANGGNTNGFSNLSNTPIIIQAGATVYAANPDAFRVDGDILFSTSGQFLIIGTATFGNKLSVGVKIYADLSKVFAGTATSANVEFLLEVPAESSNSITSTPIYSIYGVVTVTDTPATVPAFHRG